MTQLPVIFKRELGSYFATPLAYVFIVIFLVLSGVFTFYLGGFYERGQADLTPFFSFHTWLYLFLVPAIAMRLWAEERKSGSIELLMTLPITRFEAVTGKFLAAWVFAGIALLLTFPMVQKIGTALLASAGLIGLVAGIAAKPVFGNLIAGLQIAVTQPIRLDDVVIVEGEWGRIEEIGSSYVVVRIWDERRMVVPLTWFIENPFQNWTRRSADLLGTAFLWLDYRAPIAAIRAELERICRGEALWDGRVCVTQVTETSERAIQVRLLVSARSSGDAFDLRCLVRERMLDFLAREHPQSLPQVRARLQHEDELDMPRGPRARTADVRSPGAEDGEAAIVPAEPDQPL